MKEINKILFSLDLSNETLKKAVELGCDTIVTHHPAIYNPVKRLSINDDTAPIVNAICFNESPSLIVTISSQVMGYSAVPAVI